MAEGDRTPEEQASARPRSPHVGGPLGSSGAAPPEPVGREQPSPLPLPEPEASPRPPEPPPMLDVKRVAEMPRLRKDRPAPPAPTGTPETEPGEPAVPIETGDSPAPTDTPEVPPATSAPTRPAAAADSPATEIGAAEPIEPGTADATATNPAEPTTTGTAEAAKGGGAEPAKISDEKPVVVTVRSASGRRVTRVLRHANPIRVAKTAGRTTHAWAKRPTGRLMVPAIIGILLVGAAGTAGAYLVPEALRSAVAASATPGFPLEAAAPALSAPSGRPGGPSAPGLPSGGITSAGPAINGARPADALNGWAQGVGTRVGIPVVAVQAYGYAELVAARTAPNCHLSWTTLAAIAKVESAHGSANGAVLGVDGSVQPPVYGLPLDGRGGRQEIRDTDQGAIDGDTQYDRAVGPMQFIPQTWKENAVDADNSGTSDPNDIDDASLAAALYLCRGGRDMARADAWWDAILSYNAVRPYAQRVFDAANEYGRRSRV